MVKCLMSGQSSIGVFSVRTELVMGYLISGQSWWGRYLNTRQSSLRYSSSIILFLLFLRRTMVVAALDKPLSINTTQRRQLTHKSSPLSARQGRKTGRNEDVWNLQLVVFFITSMTFAIRPVSLFLSLSLLCLGAQGNSIVRQCSGQQQQQW